MEPTRQSHFEGIQTLRFIAAAFVVMTHSLFYASERLGAQKIAWSNGVSGVDIFFVISGFVMVMSTLDLVNSNDGYRTFFQLRIVRIVPMYWTATTCKLLILLLLPHLVLHAELDWQMVIKSYFFIPSVNMDGKIEPLLGVGWTLVFEMFFYLTFTAALFFRKNILLFVGPILLAFSSASLFRGSGYSPMWFLMDPIIMEFYAGMLLGYAVMKNKIMPTSLAIVVFHSTFIYLCFYKNVDDLPRLIGRGIPSALLVWSVLSLEKNIAGRIPRSLLFFGEASYSLYLFHPLVAPAAPMALKMLHIQNVILSIALSFLIAILTASLIYLLLERPITKIGKRYISRKRRITPVLQR